MSKVATIPMTQIRENPIALRSVNKSSEAFIQLVDSIKQRGLINAISVRERKDDETGDKYYELVDGLHRLTASIEAGHDKINCSIISIDDDSLVETQIIANIHKIETAPAQYAKALRQILARNPLMTEAELATRLAKSSSWIRDRLSLNKIGDAKILQLIDEGKIPLTNAYVLAKLPEAEMTPFIDRAIAMKPQQFAEEVAARVKELKEADRKGVDPGEAAFTPTAYMQKMGDIKAELENGKVGAVLCKDLKNPVEGFKRAIEWALHLDPESVAVQKAQFDERIALKKQKELERQKQKAEKAAKEAKAKAEEAAKLAAEVTDK